MRDDRDYKVEISSLPQSEAAGGGAAPGRPFLCVQFSCCSVYQRIYRDPAGRASSGRCPKCGKPVRFVVGQGGTDARFFVVS